MNVGIYLFVGIFLLSVVGATVMFPAGKDEMSDFDSELESPVTRHLTYPEVSTVSSSKNSHRQHLEPLPSAISTHLNDEDKLENEYWSSKNNDLSPNNNVIQAATGLVYETEPESALYPAPLMSESRQLQVVETNKNRDRNTTNDRLLDQTTIQQPLAEDQSTDNPVFTIPCPDSLYMGGTAYEVNMLKKAGCPKPSNYTGIW